MKNIKLIFSIAILSIALFSFTTINTSTKYKCMVQMANYVGEGAYVVISLINPDGQYEKTLYVQGDDEEWYKDIDALTGATISGGERAISVIQIEDSKIDAGYSIRFESAVEDQEYYTKDVQFLLTSESVKSKTEGSGFIRYVRLMPN